MKPREKTRRPGAIEAKKRRNPGAVKQTVATQKAAAEKRGDKRTSKFIADVKLAQAIIEADVRAHGGVYSGNDGEVSMAEVARLANVNPRSFYSPKLRTFGEEVKTWTEQFAAADEGEGERRPGKTMQERYDEVRAENEGLKETCRVTELELQNAEAKLEASEKRVAELAGEVERLTKIVAALESSKVVPIGKPRPNR